MDKTQRKKKYIQKGKEYKHPKTANGVSQGI